MTGFQRKSSIGSDVDVFLNRESSVEESENFQLCEDFFVSNLLYHTYLDPREKVIQPGR